MPVDQSSEHVILHCGTNNLPSEKNPESIAKIIITAKNAKIETFSVIFRNYPYNCKFNLKATETNNHLKDSFLKEKMPLIQLESRNTKYHWSSGSLHRNFKGYVKVRNV